VPDNPQETIERLVRENLVLRRKLERSERHRAHTEEIKDKVQALLRATYQELEQEKEKVDRLLRNVLPEEIVDELKTHGRVKSVYFLCASVLFADFTGFSAVAETMDPDELVDELDACFAAFDTIVQGHRLEKLKTIGDGYMCVGGIPRANSTHAVDSVLAAMAMVAFMHQLREQRADKGLQSWGIRVGIHTGPLVAGVVGRRRFAYDVWGDTVNTASRIESASLAGRINISEATYQAVKHRFVTEYRGRIAAKGKGEIAMYFVNGLNPEFAAAEARARPSYRPPAGPDSLGTLLGAQDGKREA
jgi:class 3 adenylate cyclase